MTNFDRMPRRSELEGRPVFHRMAEIDDMFTYMPAKEEEECKMERSFDNDTMGGTCAGAE
jgi:hypothetical protein